MFGIPGHGADLAQRCLTGTTCLITLYIAYRLMPLSDSTTIYQTAPVFVPIFTYFIFKERPKIFPVVTGIITVIGVFIISKPEFIFGSSSSPDDYDQRWLGIILSTTGAITSAMSIINLRKLATTPVPVVVMWYSATVVVIGSIVLSFIDTWAMPRSVKTWLLLWLMGCAGALDEYFQTTAFRYESPGPITVTRSFNFVLAFIWDMVIFGESLQWQSIVGALLISVCVVLTAVHKCYYENRQKFEDFVKDLFKPKQSDHITDDIAIETISV